MQHSPPEQLIASAAAETPVIHLASHFVLQPGKAADSYLLLGDGGRLSLADFDQRGLRFNNVDLLTLSACDTAAPAGGDGREVEGLGTIAQRRGAGAGTRDAVAGRGSKHRSIHVACI